MVLPYLRALCLVIHKLSKHHPSFNVVLSVNQPSSGVFPEWPRSPKRVDRARSHGIDG